MAKKPKKVVDKPHAGGTWTLAQFNTFIRNQLRRGWVKWPVKNKLLTAARIERGWYLCSCCGDKVPTTVNDDGVKKKGVNVDHIIPATPLSGIYCWDTFINRLYCEESNLQVICWRCHTFKTNLVEKRLIKLYKGGEDIEIGNLGVANIVDGPYESESTTIVEVDIDGIKQQFTVFDILHGNGMRELLLPDKKKGG